MIRVIFALSLIFPLLITGVSAGDWVGDAFPVKKHDFGTVAVAAKTEFEFPVRNPFSSAMHIRSVRTSCGCTTPVVQTSYIDPGETGSILARFNTDTFKGQRGATMTVIIDQPMYAEVRLRVDGYIRSDIVFHPGAIDFGRIEQGVSSARSTKVLYAGRSDWKIVDVKGNLPWLLPEFSEVSRGGGRVTYQIDVQVGDGAPSGFFQDELLVKTDDQAMTRVPLHVSGEVESALTISPKAIALGNLKPGQTVTHKLILLGRRPFNVASIQADGWEIRLPPATESKKMHVLYPEFTATSSDPGAYKGTIEVATSGEQSVTAKALLTAEIRDR